MDFNKLRDIVSEILIVLFWIHLIMSPKKEPPPELSVFNIITAIVFAFFLLVNSIAIVTRI